MPGANESDAPEWGEVEEEMFGLLVASERVAAWLDVLRSHRAGAPPPRVRQALRDLVMAVEGSEAYAEEVGGRAAGCWLLPEATGQLASCHSCAPLTPQPHPPAVACRPGERERCRC